MAETVEVPVSLLKKLVEAAKTFDELEDYLLAKDSKFISRMREARAEHLSGNVRPLPDLKAEHCIE